MTEPHSSIQTVKGQLVKIRAERNGWFAGEVACGRENVSVSGPVGAIPTIGCFLEMRGSYFEHPTYGRQFKFASAEASIPSDKSGAEAFLATIDGIGKARASLIVRELGGEAVTKILDDPSCLTRVPGIKAKLAEKVAAAVAVKRNTAVVEQQLCAVGLSASQRKKAVETFGNSIEEVLRDDPYRLVTIPRVGFQTVDRYVLSVKGWARSDVRRVAAAIVHAAQSAAEWGHTWCSLAALREGSRKVLATPISDADIDQGVAKAVSSRDLIRVPVVGNDAYALRALAEAETYIAERIAEMAVSASPLGGIELVSETKRKELTPEQERAVLTATSERVCVITGGPGRGKTFTLAAILEALGGADIAVCAPTGKAAKRASESVGRGATTIHRLLGRLAKAVEDDQPFPNVVVVDECSMVDVQLMAALLRALEPARAFLRLVLVGDADQLPSIGPGRILADLVDSGVAVCRLTQPMRQAAQSRIVANADRINEGEELDSSPADDWFEMTDDDPKRLAEKVVRVFTHRARLAGFDPTTEVVVLSPQRKTELGVEALNAAIRAEINPPDGTPELRDRDGKSRFRAKDRVLVTENDYELGVVNGDTGTVKAVFPKGMAGTTEDRVVVVLDDDQEVTFSGDKIQSLVHAWAMTVHKSQGSEYPLVVVVAHECMSWGLQRCLLYTAVTRGKKRVVVAGTKTAFAKAIENDRPMIRFTSLRHAVGDRLATASKA